MRRTSFRNWPCSVARTMDLLGDWWTPLVLRQAFFGSRRFDEFQAALGIGRNVLTQRLKRLVAEELFERRRYQDRPPRYEYLLTEKGADLLGVLAAIMSWGDRWLDRGKGPPVLLRHTACGHVTRAAVVCEHCREALAAPALRIEPGPGLPKRLHTALGAALGAGTVLSNSLTAPEGTVT
jgi:DNA-binding HxlR family transcriptional regulator